MINPYCETLSGIFREMVYYGILKDEDAQCFRTDVTVEPTFIVLIVAAVALAVLNSFVMGSTSQYFRDDDTKRHSASNMPEKKLSDDDDLDDLLEFEDAMLEATFNKYAIHPSPVLFTDKYRWFLHREDARRTSMMAGSLEGSHPHSVVKPSRLESQYNEHGGEQTSLDDNMYFDEESAEKESIGDDVTTFRDGFTLTEETTRRDRASFDHQFTLQSSMEETTEGDIVTLGESLPFALDATIDADDRRVTAAKSDDMGDKCPYFTLDATIPAGGVHTMQPNKV
jgi:hypothetical protein